MVYYTHSRQAGMTTWFIPASVTRAIRLTRRPAFSGGPVFGLDILRVWHMQ